MSNLVDAVRCCVPLPRRRREMVAHHHHHIGVAPAGLRCRVNHCLAVMYHHHYGSRRSNIILLFDLFKKFSTSSVVVVFSLPQHPARMPGPVRSASPKIPRKLMHPKGSRDDMLSVPKPRDRPRQKRQCLSSETLAQFFFFVLPPRPKRNKGCEIQNELRVCYKIPARGFRSTRGDLAWRHLSLSTAPIQK